MNVKWLHRLHVTDQPAMSRDEAASYTDLMPNGKARQFSFEMETNSVITRPCGGHKLEGKGFQEISGLAWTGRGKIRRVEISVDGGASWRDAELQAPIYAKALTRFRLAWSWMGEETILQSRATDETGYVQPMRDVLIAARGHERRSGRIQSLPWNQAVEGRSRWQRHARLAASLSPCSW